MDKVVHFEIPVDDLARAKKFYSTIFGWELQDMSMPDGTYTMARTVPVDEKHMPKEPGAINGGIFKRSAEVRSPVVAIDVSSVDEYLQKVTAQGGSVVMPKMEIQGMGFYAYVKDPEGNVIGLWQN